MPRAPDAIARFDLFPKLGDDFARRTAAGGALSVVGLMCIVMLFIAQIGELTRTTTTHDLIVDDVPIGSEVKMRVHVDVTLRAMHCEQVSLDVMDVTGENHLDVDAHEVRKQRIDATGKPIPMTSEKVEVNAKTEVKAKEPSEEVVVRACGDCYGAREDGACCNDCDAVREAYRSKGWALPDLRKVTQCTEEFDTAEMLNTHREGCRFTGHIDVNRVAGNFHIAPGKSFNSIHGQHVHDLSPFAGLERYDFSHKIHKISFGEEFPGVVNPLGHVSRAQDGQHQAGVYQYRLSVVPSRYRYIGLNARTVESNDYSVTDHYRGFDHTKDGGSLPGIFFFYDLSPLRMEYEERRMGLLQFLANVAAIIGGVSAVMGIVDGAVYRGQRALKEKVDLGKQG